MAKNKNIFLTGVPKEFKDKLNKTPFLTKKQILSFNLELELMQIRLNSQNGNTTI